MKVCDTPQSRGVPTNSQAMASDSPELASSVGAEELGCGFMSSLGKEVKDWSLVAAGGYRYGAFLKVPLVYRRHGQVG